MKLILALLFTLFSFSALSNCNPEAQFIGTVKNLKYFPAQNGNTEHFTFQLRPAGWFNPSMMCPLFEDEFEKAVIDLAGSPTIANGDKISGVLVFDIITQTYRID